MISKDTNLTIDDIINEFDLKIEKYYNINYLMNNEIARMFNGTNINLKEFYNIYKKSKYYKNETKEDNNINKKIIYSLIDIILLNIMINEIDMIDNIGVYAYKVENEFDNLYNLNKAMNTIYKTRVLWERIMNFSYLVFRRKELKDGKSKKTRFKNWYVGEKYIFFDELFNFISAFDDKYRTPETHSSSILRKLFFEEKISPIREVSYRLTLNFNVEIYQNILRILRDEEYVTLRWHRVKSINGDNIPEEFNRVPEWVSEFCKLHEFDIKTSEQIEVPYNIKTGQFL